MGDPAFNVGTPNRTEIYYANSSDGWTNIEIALPKDTTGPRVKRSPSIIVQNGLVHVSWIQYETDDYMSQGNVLYGNSDDWESAIIIAKYPDAPSIDPYGDSIALYWVSSSCNALAVDRDGKLHITWRETHNLNFTTRILYATETTEEFPWELFLPAILRKR